MATRIAKKLARWALFGVVVALVPVAAQYIYAKISHVGPNVPDAILNGDILLVSSTMSAGALGELIGIGDTFALAKIVAGGLATIAFMFSTLLYVYLSTATVPGISILLVSLSGIVLMLGIAASAGCIILSGV